MEHGIRLQLPLGYLWHQENEIDFYALVDGLDNWSLPLRLLEWGRTNRTVILCSVVGRSRSVLEQSRKGGAIRFRKSPGKACALNHLANFGFSRYS